MPKAISPILAALLLIAMVIGIALFATPFFTGIVKEKAKKIEAYSSTDCYYTNLNLHSILAAPPFLYLGISNDGQNDLYGLAAAVLIRNKNTVKEEYDEWLNTTETKTFRIRIGDEPFEQIIFWGLACPGHKVKKSYSWIERSLSGDTGEITIMNEGEVVVTPIITITAT